MSEIRWCDPGGHAFPYGKDADERTWADTVEREGRRARIDVCGPCGREGVLSASKAIAVTTFDGEANRRADVTG